MGRENGRLNRLDQKSVQAAVPFSPLLSISLLDKIVTLFQHLPVLRSL